MPAAVSQAGRISTFVTFTIFLPPSIVVSFFDAQGAPVPRRAPVGPGKTRRLGFFGA
jgi:hypothetical protein